MSLRFRQPELEMGGRGVGGRGCVMACVTPLPLDCITWLLLGRQQMITERRPVPPA